MMVLTPQCPRCLAKMIHSHHEEVEHIEEITFVTQVYTSECPTCTAFLSLRLPVIPVETT